MRVDSDARFFVYALAFPKGSDFYIGKGALARPASHVTEARSGVLTPKCAIIRHIIHKLKRDVQCRILFETDDENHALWAEMKAISSLPYGSLCNISGGGSRSIVGAVTQQYEHLWDAWVFEQNEYKHRKAIAHETGGTRILAQQAIAPFYDGLILPEYFSRINSRARKVRVS